MPGILKEKSRKTEENEVIKDRNGGNRDGLGMYELAKLALTHPVYFSFLLLLIKGHMNTLAKKFLGIH